VHTAGHAFSEPCAHRLSQRNGCGHTAGCTLAACVPILIPVGVLCVHTANFSFNYLRHTAHSDRIAVGTSLVAYFATRVPIAHPGGITVGTRIFVHSITSASTSRIAMGARLIAHLPPCAHLLVPVQVLCAHSQSYA
jgi:hypothetical protein